MTDEKKYVRVKSESGESVRRILLEAGILDTDYRISSIENFLFLPITEDIDSAALVSLLQRYDYETGNMSFERVLFGPKSLEDALHGQLDDSELKLLPRAYDLIGDIAVLEIPDEIFSDRFKIGSAFLKLHTNFSTVLAKLGAISGTNRIREYDLIAGEDKTTTIHTEYGCRIAVDLSKAYFSPRLLEEHNRVSTLVQEDEHVVDMFTGVGPFALHIARRCKAKITAIDINPDAISLLQKSMTLNKLIGEITPVVADAHEYTSTNFDHSVDRIIMNHPSGAEDFITVACNALKPSGILHYYDFIGGSNPDDILRNRIHELVENADHNVAEISLTRRIRDSAPYEWQMVADVIIV